MEDRSGLCLETLRVPAAAAAGQGLPSGNMRGKRPIVGEQKAVTALRVLQSCARERSCLCTVDNPVSLRWARSYRNRPCCCNADEVGAVSSALAWNRDELNICSLLAGTLY